MLKKDAVRFLRTTVGSLWALEQLLLLYRSGERIWRVEELVLELRSNRKIATAVLDRLVAVGLVERIAEGFRYRPQSALHVTVASIVEHYARHPFTVTQAIFLDHDQDIQSFADAFRITKKENE